MQLALPGARGLFSRLQDTLRRPTPCNRIALTPGVHAILQEFRELSDQLELRPTRLYELVPLQPTLIGDHDAAGPGAGGVWFPTPTAVPRSAPVRHTSIRTPRLRW